MKTGAYMGLCFCSGHSTREAVLAPVRTLLGIRGDISMFERRPFKAQGPQGHGAGAEALLEWGGRAYYSKVTATEPS